MPQATSAAEKPVYSVTARGWAGHIASDLDIADLPGVPERLEPIIAKIQQEAYRRGFDDGYEAGM